MENSLMLAAGAICFGIYLLIKGGDWTINAAIYIAKKFNISPLCIGFTIIAFGTSLPELVVSINANMDGYPGISLGNVIGSNIANILFVLGVTSIVYPIITQRKDIWRDCCMLIAASIALLFATHQHQIAQLQGGIFFATLLLYVFYQFMRTRGHEQEYLSEHGDDLDPDHELGTHSTAYVSGILVVGLGLITLGSEFLIKGAISAGTTLGVPEAIIGLTAVALGTSLPELATSLAAAKKHQTKMILGNIIGSNLFNILSIVGLTALIKPIALVPEMTGINIWIMLATTIAMSAWFITRQKLGRVAGSILTISYVGFIVFQYLK